MNERIVRMDPANGNLRIIALEDAVSELSGRGLYSEIALRLRGGETVRAPDGPRYRSLAALDAFAIDPLPPSDLS